MLFAVVVFKPFRDSEGTDGYTGADKSEIIALLCYLGELCVGILCMRERRDSPGHKLSAAQNALATVAGLFFVGFPRKFYEMAPYAS